MSPVDQALVTIAVIFAVGAIGEGIFRKTGLPDVVWLIAVGVLIGPVLGLVSAAELMAIAPLFAAITLVVVLFEGGSNLKLGELGAAVGRALLTATLTFGLSMLLVTGLVMLGIALGICPESWNLMHGLLLGSILGGSSSIVIMPAMALAKVEPKVSNLVNLESAFTDVFCVVGASVLISLMSSEAAGSAHPALVLGQSFGIALAIGAAGGLLALVVLPFLEKSDHAYTHMLAGLLGLYVVVGLLEGSAALAVLTFAVIVGNAASIRKGLHMKGVGLGLQVTSVHSQIAFIIKSFFFTFIGTMLGPPWPLFALGVGFGVMLLGARFVAVRIALLGQSFDPARRRVVVTCLPRGLAAGVLATLPAASGIPDVDFLPPLVFAAVLTSILIFAFLFPLAKKGLTPPAPAPAGSPGDNAQPPASAPS